MIKTKEIFIRARQVKLRKGERVLFNQNLTSPDRAAIVASHFLRDLDTESIAVVAVDSMLQPLSIEIVAQGGPSQCPLFVQKVFRGPIMMGAPGFFLFHNHPSGTPEATKDDLELTRKIHKGAQLLGLTLHDHMIIMPHGRLDNWISIRQTYSHCFH